MSYFAIAMFSSFDFIYDSEWCSVIFVV